MTSESLLNIGLAELFPCIGGDENLSRRELLKISRNHDHGEFRERE
jgi:hypothetical protein